MLIAYWFVCFPSGLFFDYVLSLEQLMGIM